MAFTCRRPIVNSRTRKFIVKISFQFLTSLNPLDALVFDYTARFDLSTI
jgi:hypothetical protein